jgi:uncharacterized protein DUF6510
MDKNSRRRSEGAREQGDAARLDGNAAAGILSEIFVSDLTVAHAICANCGTNRPLGALMVYAHGMGTIMRCPNCDAAVLRVARTRAHLQLDLTGASVIVVPRAPAPFAT